MEELYSETYLKAKPSPKRTALRFGLIFLCLFLVVVDLMVFKSLYLLIFVFIVDAMIIYFLPKKNVAYEYVFVDGQIDFDFIINCERRKHKKRIDMEKIELIAPEDAPVLYNSRNLPMEDYSSRMSGDKHYIAVVLGDKGKERIRFTPDEKMLELMKLKGRSKVQEA